MNPYHLAAKEKLLRKKDTGTKSVNITVYGEENSIELDFYLSGFHCGRIMFEYTDLNFSVDSRLAVRLIEGAIVYANNGTIEPKRIKGMYWFASIAKMMGECSSMNGSISEWLKFLEEKNVKTKISTIK